VSAIIGLQHVTCGQLRCLATDINRQQAPLSAQSRPA